MRWGAVLIMLCGCGRIAFEPLAGDGGNGDSSPGDGGPGGGAAWTSFLTATSVRVKRVALGPGGEVAVTGEVNGVLAIDGVTHPATSALSMLVARYAADGTRTWSVVHTGSAVVDGRDVVIDSAGRVLVHGLNGGDATIGSTPVSAGTGQDPLTIVHGAGGTVDAVSVFTSAGANAQGRGISVGAADAVYVGGSFEGSVVVDGVALADQPGMASYLARPGGWVRMYAGTGTRAAVNDVDAHPAASSVCAGGDFVGPVDFAGVNQSGASMQDGFVAVHGDNGVVLGVATILGANFDRVDAVAQLATGDCVVSGTTNSPALSFDGPGLGIGTYGGIDGFVARYADSGALQWSHLLGGPLDDTAYAVAVAQDGTIAVAGPFSDTAMFAGKQATANGFDVFVLLLAPDGTAIDLWTLGGPGEQYANGVAIDSTRRVIAITGELENGATFGDATTTAATGSFVHRFSY